MTYVTSERERKGNGMNNIEKYTNTKDAIEAYDRIEFKDVTFYEWLFSHVRGASHEDFT